MAKTAVNRLTVKTEGNTPYDICLKNSFSSLAQELDGIGCGGRRLCIVSDSNVADLYLKEVTEEAKNAGKEVISFVFPAGEQSKTLATVQQLYETLIQAGFDRKDYLLALGGGVVGDLAGYAAATYLRGIRFVQIPTSLLAQIDSSVEGKTGVDFDQYKNMVGAFHQPSLVYINVPVLKTLPDDQLASGVGELLKYGLSFDADFYEWCIEHMEEIDERDSETMTCLDRKVLRTEEVYCRERPDGKR